MSANRSFHMLGVAVLVILCCGFPTRATNTLLIPTLTKARCYANCLTQVTSELGRPDPGCKSSSCQKASCAVTGSGLQGEFSGEITKCILPCGQTFSKVDSCYSTCKNSSICLKSCEFLVSMQNWSNIFTGDGSTVPRPGVPIVNANATNVTMLTLLWRPPVNVTDGVVYLLKTRHTHNNDGIASPPPSTTPEYLRMLVFTEPMAVIRLADVCRYVRTVNRRNWNGLTFNYRIVALTKNSTLAEGGESTAIMMPRPDPVTSVTYSSFTYDATSVGNKLLFLASVVPPSGLSRDIITRYAIEVPSQTCPGSDSALTSLSNYSPVGSTNATLQLGEKLKACNLTMKIFSVANCIPSAPTEFKFYYRGCRFTESYNKNDCYKFDPPPTPDSDRSVRNLTFTPLTASQDYIFHTNVTWSPPAFPYAYESFIYNVQVLTSRTICFFSRCFTNNNFVVIGKTLSEPYMEVKNTMKPGKKYKFMVVPRVDSKAWKAIAKTIVVSIPAVPIDHTIVQNLTARFTTYSRVNMFSVIITWVKPQFKYGTIQSYSVIYRKGNDPEKTVNVTQPGNMSKVIHAFHHNERLVYKVKANFNETWITTVAKATEEKFTRAEAVPIYQTIVQNLTARFTTYSRVNMFSVIITWVKPKFKYGTIQSYSVIYRKGNVPEKTVTVTQPGNMSGVIHGFDFNEPLVYKVKANFNETWISSVANTTEEMFMKAEAAEGSEIEVKPVETARFQEHIETNRFTWTTTWKPPSVKNRPVMHYKVSYRLSGYPDTINCWRGGINSDGCQANTTNQTFYSIRRIRPKERIYFTVTPVFVNSRFLKGKEIQLQQKADAPRDVLVTVRDLKHKLNSTMGRNVFSWKSPLFSHSTVSHYNVKYVVSVIQTESTNRRRRAVNGSGTVDSNTTATSHPAPLVPKGSEMIFQVTPVFGVSIVDGKTATRRISRPLLPSMVSPLGVAEIAGLAIGILFLLLLALLLVMFIFRRLDRIKKGKPPSSKRGGMIDHWEVDEDKIILDEDLGEGAFGKVFKGFLLDLPEQSSKYSVGRKKRTRSVSQKDGYVVAIKMLHDTAEQEQTQEFLKEIQLMKNVGSHRNIVNMLGCCTITEPMFLVVEYLPHGDLLHYLRKRRGKVKEYPHNDPRGPYHSNYCQAILKKGDPDGGFTIQKTREDRAYFHFDDQKESGNVGVQLVTVRTGIQINQDRDDMTSNSDNAFVQDDVIVDDDDCVTSGDLMAFAWQVGQGMEYLAKRGYVHRDLAARNVLVGENKVAKVADFGLTRHMYDDLYQGTTNRKLPLKWMSVEAIFDQIFTSQSDVWAYGVFLWELVTMGGTPYPTINNRELLKLLKEGHRMEKPDTCDDELYQIMCKCWREKPESRPTFCTLREHLEEMMMRENPYFDPSAVDESSDYYNVPSFNSAQDAEVSDDVIEVILGKSPNNESAKSEAKPQKTESENKDVLKIENEEEAVEKDRDETMEEENKISNEVGEGRDTVNNLPPSRKTIQYTDLDFETLEAQLYRRRNSNCVL